MKNAEIVREQNIRLRQTLTDGQVVITAGIAARSDVEEILCRVRAFDTWTNENDIWQEADFGSFEIGDETILWKIDAYSVALSGGSPNPADPAVTTRVLTIMLSSEY